MAVERVADELFRSTICRWLSLRKPCSVAWEQSASASLALQPLPAATRAIKTKRVGRHSVRGNGEELQAPRDRKGGGRHVAGAQSLT